MDIAEAMEKYSAEMEQKKTEYLFNPDCNTGELCEEAQQYFILALTALGQAESFFKLAAIKHRNFVP